MTAENAKRLYEHLKSIGRTEEAEAIAKGRPEVLEGKKEKNKKTED